MVKTWTSFYPDGDFHMSFGKKIGTDDKNWRGSKFSVEILTKFGSGVKVGNKIPTFYGQDRLETFVYEQKLFEIF